MKELGREDLHSLFQVLNARLSERGEKAHVFVVGGAAMALQHDAQRRTMDVDGFFQPSVVVREVAKDIADEYGLPDDWLNDGAKGFMPKISGQEMITAFESESLLVQVPPVEYLLAMKLMSGRDKDKEDAITLWNLAGYTSVDEGLALLEKHYPPYLLEVKHRYIVEDIYCQATARTQNNAIDPEFARSLAVVEAAGLGGTPRVQSREHNEAALPTSYPAPPEPTKTRDTGRSL